MMTIVKHFVPRLPAKRERLQDPDQYRAAPQFSPVLVGSLSGGHFSHHRRKAAGGFLYVVKLAIVLFAVSSVHAQELHLSAGYNGSKVSKAGMEDWTGRAGYQFGLDVFLGQRWFLKPGIHYVQRSLSYAVTDNALHVTDRATYTSRGITIPVMLGTYFLDPEDRRSFNAYFMAGPTALIGLNADLGNDVLTVETRSAQWYLGLGLGLSYGPVFVEGGYNAAMSNVFKGEGLDTNPRVNNTYVVAGVRLILAE